MFEIENKITVFGGINKPGEYVLKKDMTISDLILEAGGLIENRRMFFVEIARKRNEFDNPKTDRQEDVEIFSYELKNEMSLYIPKSKIKQKNKILLKPFDEVTIRLDRQTSEFSKVEIVGFVKYPGTYALSGPNTFVHEIIERAGGLKKEAYPAASLFIRKNKTINVSFERLLKFPNTRYNFKLIDGDSLIINSYTNLVEIEGAVNNPGNFQYIPGKRVSDYIKTAGGFSDNKMIDGSFVLYPDGNSKKISTLNYSLFSPKVMDGSKIFIAELPQGQEFSLTDYVTNLTTLYADLMQSYILLIALSRGT